MASRQTRQPLAKRGRTESLGGKKEILITGGAGFIGSNLAKRLVGDGHMVYVVDNLITGHYKNIEALLSYPNFKFFELDIVGNEFKQKFKSIHLDVIFHLACPTGVPNIALLGEEMIQTCSNGTINVLEIARVHNAIVLYSSSAEVYGAPEVTPQHEGYTGNVHPTGPRSAYEEGKRFGETLVTLYTKKYGVNTRIIRIFNTYGPGMSLTDQRVFPQFLKAISSGTPITIYGDGEQTRTHCYVDDLINGFLIAIEKGESGEIYNIGGNEATTIKDLARLMISLTVGEHPIEHKPHFIEDHKHRLPHVEKIKSLGWKRVVPLEEGLRHMIVGNGFAHLLAENRIEEVEVKAQEISSNPAFA